MEEPETVSEAVLLEELYSVYRARTALDARIGGLVAHLRDVGATWETIGYNLHMTKQGAQQRFSA